MGPFQNGMRARHFNESLAQKPAVFTNEIMTCAECYNKGGDSNKKARDVKEHLPHRNQYITSPALENNLISLYMKKCMYVHHLQLNFQVKNILKY